MPFFLQVNTLAPHGETASDDLATCESYIHTLNTIRPPLRHVDAAKGLELPKPPSYDEADISDKSHWLIAAAPEPMPDAMRECLRMIDKDRLESLLGVDEMLRDIFGKLALLAETNL